MNAEKWVELIVAILSGLAAGIPLVWKLIQYVGQVIRDRNWTCFITTLMSYMSIAEKEFAVGADRKQWVMDAIDNTSDIVNYEVDAETLSTLIEMLIQFSKQVNPPVAEESAEDGNN